MTHRRMSPPPLTQRSALALAAAIRAGEVSSREVLDAHLALLDAVNPRLNAVVAQRREQARSEAAAADARVARGGPGLPPLLGVPCTIKESISLAGMPNAAGVVARRDVRAERSAPAVQRLLDAGAIPLGVTNTSELTMWIESENRLYGRTHNAYAPERIAGGSSGGEGAAIGAGLAPFGLGSDIGGSIRLPAFFNGVFGHKPSPGLIPNTGQWPVTQGEASRLLTIGPLARRAEDLMPLLEILAGPDGEDPQAREVTLGDPAAVALAGLPVVLVEGRLLPPVGRELRRCSEQAAAALGRAGADVLRLPLRRMRRALDLYLVALAEGAGVTTREVLEAAGASWSWRAALRRGGDHTRALRLLVLAESLFGRRTAGQTGRAIAAGQRLAAEIEEAVGDGVLLHPPFSRPAPRHGRTVGRPWVIAQAAVFNLAGLPVTQVPTGLNGDGLPLGVQVVAGRDRDHVAIAAALELERALGGWTPPI